MDNNSLYHSELITGDYLPKVVAYYFKQWEGYRMPFHAHNAVEIMYVISGSCIIDIGQSAVALKKGDFILIDANVTHKLNVEEDHCCRMLNVEFVFVHSESKLPNMKDLVKSNQVLALLLSKNNPYLVLKDPNDVYHILKSLVLELDNHEIESGLMIHLLISQLLIRIARLAVEARENEPQQADIYVKKTIAYLHHHYDCDIQVKDLAAVVNLHPSYLHRIFKANMKCTVVEYLTLLRMEKAKMLLTQTDIPVIEISEYIGINSRQYFSAIFKKSTGKTPIEYRRTAIS